MMNNEINNHIVNNEELSYESEDELNVLTTMEDDYSIPDINELNNIEESSLNSIIDQNSLNLFYEFF